MKGHKVKLTLIDENDNVVDTSEMTGEEIEEFNIAHKNFICIFNEHYRRMLREANETKKK